MFAWLAAFGGKKKKEEKLILAKYRQYQCYVTGGWRLEGVYCIMKAVSKREAAGIGRRQRRQRQVPERGVLKLSNCTVKKRKRG